MHRSSHFKRVLQAACLCGAAMLVTACTTGGQSVRSNDHMSSSNQPAVAACCAAHGTANAKACCKQMKQCCMTKSNDKDANDKSDSGSM